MESLRELTSQRRLLSKPQTQVTYSCYTVSPVVCSTFVMISNNEIPSFVCRGFRCLTRVDNVDLTSMVTARGDGRRSVGWRGQFCLRLFHVLVLVRRIYASPHSLLAKMYNLGLSGKLVPKIFGHVAIRDSCAIGVNCPNLTPIFPCTFNSLVISDILLYCSIASSSATKSSSSSAATHLPPSDSVSSTVHAIQPTSSSKRQQAAAAPSTSSSSLVHKSSSAAAESLIKTESAPSISSIVS